MALDNLKQSQFVGALSEILTSLSALVRSELRLAKAEMATIVAKKMSAAVWLGAAGVVGLVALIVLALAAAAGLAAAGLGLPWALLIVAVVLAAVAGGAAAKGMANAKGSITPERTFRNITQDIASAKEHFS